MKKNSSYFLLILCIAVISCKTKKNHFTINANLENISNGTLFYLESWDTRKIIDSAYVYNGSLSLEGKLTHPENLFLYATDSLSKEFIYTNLLIGYENIHFNATKQDFPWNIDASGSVSQDLAEKFNQLEYQKQNITKHLKEVFDNKNKELLAEQLNQVSDSMHKGKIKLIKENFKYYKTHFSTEELTNLYQKLSSELKQSKYGKAIKIQIEYPAPNVGDVYYDYSALNQNGNTVSLSQIKDKYILLHFSSAACYPSQKSLPEQKHLYKNFKEKLEIVKISQDSDKEVWKKSIEKDSIPWTNLWDRKGAFSNAVLKYGTIGTPNYILISPDKIILEKWFGYEDGIIKDKIEKYLNK